MTDVKKYLQHIKLCDSNINTKIKELQHLKELVTRITPVLKDDPVSGGGSYDKLGDTVAKIVDLQNEINAEIDDYINSKQKIFNVIDKVNDPYQRKILYERYVFYETWEKIACDMNMTYRNVCYIHGKALKTVKYILEGEEE